MDEATLFSAALSTCASLVLAHLIAHLSEPQVRWRCGIALVALGVAGPFERGYASRDRTRSMLLWQQALLLLAPLGWLLACGIYLGHKLRSGRPPLLGLLRALVLLVAVLVILILLLRHCPLDARLCTRIWLLAGAHLAVCTLDCRRSCGDELSPRLFTHALAEALAYVAPVFPAMAIAASATLLLGSSVLTLFNVSPERLQSAVRWLSLHSPFWVVHARVRTTCMQKRSLPSVIESVVIPSQAHAQAAELSRWTFSRGIPTHSTLLR